MRDVLLLAAVALRFWKIEKKFNILVPIVSLLLRGDALARVQVVREFVEHELDRNKFNIFISRTNIRLES